jgi:hypothetical protein
VSDQYTTGAEHAVKNNPSLSTDPAAVNYAVQQDPYAAAGVANVMKLSGVHNGVLEAMGQHAYANKNAGGFWSGLTHFGEGLVTGTADLFKGLANVANRTVTTAAEAMTLGAVGSKGFFNFAGNLKDAYDTGANVIKSVQPFGQSGSWNLLRHVAAYYETMARRKGIGYLLGNVTPQVVASLFGGEVLTGAGIGGEAVDAANLSKLQSLIDNGTATENDLARFTSISARMARRKNAVTAGEDAQAEEATAYAKLDAKQGQSFKWGENTGKTLYQPIRWTVGSAFKGMGAVNRITGGVKANAFYAMAQAAAHADPYTRALWEKTINGEVYDANNRLVGGVGDSLAKAFGLSGPAASIVAGTTDFATAMGSDPLALAGQIKAGAQSAEGIGGLLGRWWKGIGIENGADVERVYNQSRNVRQTFQFQAENTASEIEKAFKNKYPPEVLAALGRAKTAEEVMQIHADVADAYFLTRNIAPTLNIYRKIGLAIRDILASQPNAVALTENELESSQRLTEEFQKYFDINKVDVRPKDVLDASRADLGARGSAIARRWLARNITEVPWLIQDAQRAGELPSISNTTFRMGDPNAIEPLLNQYRMTGLWSPFEIDNLETALRAATEPADFYHTYLNLSAAMVESAITRVTKKAVYDTLHIELRQEIKDRLQAMIDAGAGGGPGLYVNGELGQVLSQAENMTDSTEHGFWGIGFGDLSQARFLDPREIVGMVNKMQKALPTLDTRIINEANRVRSLTEFDLFKAAEHKGASLEGVSAKMDSELAGNVKQFEGSANSEALINGHQSALDYVKKVIDKNENLISQEPARQFALATREISQTTMQAEKDLAQAIAKRDKEIIQQQRDIQRFSESVPPDFGKLVEAIYRKITPLEHIDFYRGQLAGMQNYERQLVSRVAEPVYSMQELRNAIWEPAAVDEQAREASRKARIEIGTKLNDQRIKATSYMDKRSFANDFMNKVQTRLFIPQMLSSGGYIMRIGVSELLPNILRIGPKNYIASRLAASIAKHEFRGVPLQEAKTAEGEVVSEKALISQHVLSVANQLMDKPDNFDNFLKGMLTGVEKAILKDMKPDRFYRMLDDFAGAIMATGGHLPDIGHHTNQLFDSGSIAAHASQTVYGLDENGNEVASQMYHGPGWEKVSGEHSGTALHNNLARVHVDMIKRNAMSDLRELLQARGSTTMTKDGFNQLWDQLTERTYARLQQIPEEQRKLFGRNNLVLSPTFSTGDPLKDWAKVVAYNDMALVHGRLQETYIFHPELIDQAITGEIHSAQAMAKWMKDQKGAHPTNLIDRQLTKYPWSTHGAKGVVDAISRLPQGINSVTVDKFFGRLIPWMSREPVFLWEYHQTMEELRGHMIVRDDRASTKLVDEIESSIEKNAIPPSEYYHGSSKQFPGGELGDVFAGGASTNLFGPGFYTTDNPEVARSYTGKGAAKAKSSGEFNKTVYGIKWKGDKAPNLIDLEAPAPKEFRNVIQRYLSEEGFLPERDISYLKSLLDDPEETGAFIYREFKDNMDNALYVGGHEQFMLDEILHDVAIELKDAGFDGFRYQGGKYVGGENGLHEARIFFDPQNKLAIETSTPAEQVVERLVQKEKIIGTSSPLISQDAAELKALNQAFRRMTLYIHNPADRLAFEKASRTLAPFWFAKNQAYRRAFRLLEENPAAFDYYIKLSLLGTHYLQRHEAGANDTIEIPHTSWIPGFFGWAASGGNSMFANLGFDVALNPSSLRTIFVTGDKTGLTGLLPDIGTYISVPLKVIGSLWNNKDYQDFLTMLLGPVGSKTGIGSDLVPNPLFRGLATIGANFAFHGFGKQDPGDAYSMQVSNDVMLAALTSKSQTYIQTWVAAHPVTANYNHDQQLNDAISYSDQQMMQLYNNNDEWDKFVQQAHMSSYGVYLAKLVSGFSLPAAASLRDKFGKYPEFEKIMKQKDPQGNPIDFQTGAAEFAMKHPEHLLDLMSKSQTPYGSFAENAKFVEYANANPDMIKSTPNFASYIFPKGGRYDSTARTMQLSMSLRQIDNSDEFRKAMMVTTGNDYYYRHIEPMYGTWRGENDPNNYISSEGYNQMVTWARTYGNLHNRFWLEDGSPFGAGSGPKETAAYEQAIAFLNTPSLQEKALSSGLLTRTDVNNLGVVMTAYNNLTQQIINVTSPSDKSALKKQLKDQMMQYATQLKGSNIVPFITDVLAKYPTVK